ncbi:MAG TPA: hypothetical protein VHY91_07085 [Pirellulales bacterium]|jgi:hypothetical protein|nr:hypothetical protein [Pirellulales bacterium]
MGLWTLIAAVEPIATEGAKNLSPEKVHRARTLIPALAGIAILGFALVGLVWWSAHLLRRRLRHRLGSSRPVRDAWYQKPAPNDLSSDPDEPRS